MFGIIGKNLIKKLVFFLFWENLNYNICMVNKIVFWYFFEKIDRKVSI